MAVDIPVSEIMRKAVLTIRPNDTIEKAAQIVKKAGVGGIVVADKGKIVGMLTVKDIIKEVVAEGKNTKKTLVKQVMKSPVKTINIDTDLQEAARIMRDLNIERLPIMKKGKLVGIITARNVVQAAPAMLEMMKEKGNLEAITERDKEPKISGECDNCSNYSDLLRLVSGELLCEDCRT